MKIVRHCANCGAPVVKRHDTWKQEILVRDERGRFIEEWKRDGGVWKMRLRTVQVPVRGLGHWTCTRGCPKRFDSVTVDSGRRAPNGNVEYISRPRQRDIIVETSSASAASA